MALFGPEGGDALWRQEWFNDWSAANMHAVIGAAVFGYLFKLWPLEAAITAALCSCDGGGSGDIAILSASNRMQLLPGNIEITGSE